MNDFRPAFLVRRVAFRLLGAAIGLGLAFVFGTASCGKDEGSCAIGTLPDSDVPVCACGDSIDVEDQGEPTASCSADQFAHGVCCGDDDGCRCKPVTCARNESGSCSCYSENVFDFSGEDTRVEECLPPAGGVCCVDAGGLCSCGSECGDDDVVVDSCTPDEVGCFSGYESKVDGCS